MLSTVVPLVSSYNQDVMSSPVKSTRTQRLMKESTHERLNDHRIERGERSFLMRAVMILFRLE